jgi:hypothetical protein
MDNSSGHAHGHLCFFPSCRYISCLAAQADAGKYGFTEAGDIAYPPPKTFPWELDAA